MTTDTRAKAPQLTARENVHVRVHDIDELREAFPGWDENPKWVKQRLARRVAPLDEQHHENTTCISLHEYLAENLHPATASNESASHLAVGTGTTQPASGDGSLESEVYRVATTDDAVNGGELFTSTFLDTSEANGNTLTEVGLVTDDGSGSNLLLNHSLISGIEKTSNTTATVDVTLRFEAA